MCSKLFSGRSATQRESPSVFVLRKLSETTQLAGTLSMLSELREFYTFSKRPHDRDYLLSHTGDIQTFLGNCVCILQNCPEAHAFQRDLRVPRTRVTTANHIFISIAFQWGWGCTGGLVLHSPSLSPFSTLSVQFSPPLLLSPSPFLSSPYPFSPFSPSPPHFSRLPASRVFHDVVLHTDIIYVTKHACRISQKILSHASTCMT